MRKFSDRTTTDIGARTIKFNEKLKLFAGSFTTGKRDNGEKFVKLADDALEWMTDVVCEAHGDMLLEDWRYEAIHAVANELVDRGIESADDAQEAAHEIADGLVDVYTSDLANWMASNLSRIGYCDDAVANFGSEDCDMDKRMQMGQYAEYLEIVSLLASALDDAMVCG